MKSKIIIFALALIAFTLVIYSCDTRTYDEISGGAIVHPTYTKDIKPIMDNYCVSCHNESGSYPDLTTYSSVSENAESVYNAINDGSMPQGGDKLSNTTIKTFQNWMTDGKPEN